jgi:hypothetical protein
LFLRGDTFIRLLDGCHHISYLLLAGGFRLLESLFVSLVDTNFEQIIVFQVVKVRDHFTGALKFNHHFII